VAALVFITPPLSEFALKFNAPEYFLLAALGITASASLGSSSAIKALMAAVLGLAWWTARRRTAEGSE
jgi:putative tricarboxylic transport membrane protein